jgi:hypothetical protein
LDLTGVRLQDLRASDLRPSSLKRDFYSANARVVQYYEGLRVVYELESRVHDLQSATDNDVPASAPAPQAGPSQPNGQSPAGQPGQSAPAAKPEQKQGRGAGPSSRTVPPTGTSRSQGVHRTLLLAALEEAAEPLIGLKGATAAKYGNEELEGSLV